MYHAANESLCSWYDFACEMFKLAGIKINVELVQRISNKSYTST
ncbi:NAD(P)-dependent oxidoreductase [Megamonas funiformis]|nr:NAD(P)-dependent oxidoreductase [Megamonas funiformis]